MTEPLTSSDCDLRDFPFMPLDVQRLRDSDLAREETPEACWAAVQLWGAAWHQVPAGSLPDNDRVLANLAGYGRVVDAWLPIREAALRGFIRCSDGRLYHPVVSAKARESWQKKLEQRWRTECSRIKKANQRTGADEPLPTFAEFLAQRGCGQPPARAPLVPEDTGACLQGQSAPVHQDSADFPEGHGGPKRSMSPSCLQGNGIQERGTGTGTGTLVEDASASSLAAKAPAKSTGKRKPEGPIPEGYPDAQVIAVSQALLREAGVDLDAGIQAERFRNHALQNDRRCRDWAAAWRNWLSKALETAPRKSIPGRAVERLVWTGPADLRAHIVRNKSEEWAVSWLDRCGWQDLPTPTLLPTTDLQARRIEQEVGHILRLFNVTIQLERGAA